jgi:NADH-quinone oxidoreductase subunit K
VWSSEPYEGKLSRTVLGGGKAREGLPIQLNYVLTVFVILFFIGILGLVLNRKNIIITLMALELMLLAVNLNFIVFSVYLDDIVGQVFVLFILTIAATESSIGLALLMVYFKLKNSIHMEKIKKLKK